MMLISRGDKGVVFRLDHNVANQSRSAAISILNGIDASFELGPNNEAHELLLMISKPNQGTQVFRDLNLDGVWDVRQDLQNHLNFILFENQWKSVEQISGQRPNLEAVSGQTQFLFNSCNEQQRFK